MNLKELTLDQRLEIINATKDCIYKIDIMFHLKTVTLRLSDNYELEKVIYFRKFKSFDNLLKRIKRVAYALNEKQYETLKAEKSKSIEKIISIIEREMKRLFTYKIPDVSWEVDLIHTYFIHDISFMEKINFDLDEVEIGCYINEKGNVSNEYYFPNIPLNLNLKDLSDIDEKIDNIIDNICFYIELRKE